MADGFNDELTAEEEAKLVELSTSATPPPASSEGEDADAAPAAAEPAPGAEPAAAAPAAGEPAAAEPVADVNAEADADAKETFDAFAAKHKDRTPDELLKLAFQKEQARKSARFDAKAARDIVTDLRDGLQKRQAARTEQQKQERAAFDETLANDPDKAATMAFDRQQAREREEAEAIEWQGYVAAQTEICRTAIPRFSEVAPEMMQFGVERLGYEPQQVQAAHDSRDMIALYMASRFDRLVQAGIVNFDGSLVNAGQPAPAAAAPAAAAPIGRQAPLTLSAAPGTGGGGAKSLKDQAQDLLSMNDADFDKAVEQGAFDATLRSLSGGSR